MGTSTVFSVSGLSQETGQLRCYLWEVIHCVTKLPIWQEQAFLTRGTSNLFICFSVIGDRTRHCPKLEHSQNMTCLATDLLGFSRKGRMHFCVLNHTGGNLGLSGRGQQWCVPQTWRFTGHNCKISSQVTAATVLCMKYYRTLWKITFLFIHSIIFPNSFLMLQTVYICKIKTLVLTQKGTWNPQGTISEQLIAKKDKI